MSNYGKGIPLSTGFDLGAELPLDSRLTVDTIDELDAMVLGHRVYVGMKVYVTSVNQEYKFNGTDWELVPDKTYVDDAVANVKISDEQLANYATKDEIPTKTSQLENDSSYATESFVTNKIAEAKLEQSDIDLSGFQTKEDNMLETTNKTVVGAINEVNTTVMSKANDIFEASMNTVSSLGGIPAGADLNGLSIQQVLTQLLYPYVKPTVSASITYSPSKSVYEFGDTISVTQISTRITKKSENIASINFYQNNSLIHTITENCSNGGSFSFDFVSPVNIASSISNSYFKVIVSDSTSMVTANTNAFTFVYPYYYGVINDDATITEALIKGLTKQVVTKSNKTYTYNPNFQRMVIAYPKSYGVLKSILDPNGFEQMASFTMRELNIVCADSTTQTYYVYYNNSSTNTNFNMTFKY